MKITAKRLQKRLQTTASEEQDYDQQMAYLLSMKEKLEASVRKYESQSAEGKFFVKAGLYFIIIFKLKIQLSQQRGTFASFKLR